MPHLHCLLVRLHTWTIYFYFGKVSAPGMGGVRPKPQDAEDSDRAQVPILGSIDGTAELGRRRMLVPPSTTHCLPLSQWWKFFFLFYEDDTFFSLKTTANTFFIPSVSRDPFQGAYLSTGRNLMWGFSRKGHKSTLKFRYLLSKNSYLSHILKCKFLADRSY